MISNMYNLLPDFSIFVIGFVSCYLSQNQILSFFNRFVQSFFKIHVVLLLVICQCLHYFFMYGINFQCIRLHNKLFINFQRWLIIFICLIGDISPNVGFLFLLVCFFILSSSWTCSLSISSSSDSAV